MILVYILGMKGVSSSPTFSVFQLKTIYPPPLCLSMPLIYDVYYDNTHIHAKWLAEARGGKYLYKSFPDFIMFTDKIWLFPPIISGGRVVRWCWVNFQCQGVLLIWIKVGQGPTALAVGAGGGCLAIFFSRLSFLFSFSPSL